MQANISTETSGDCDTLLNTVSMMIMISEIIMIMMIRVVIRAAVNIKKGEHISINYSDPMWGTCNRQIHLGKSHDGNVDDQRC